MTLPDLPRRKTKREADITPRILAALVANLGYTMAVEIKVSQGSTLPSAALKDHQYLALKQAKRGCLVHKIGDYGHRTPFDAFVLNHTHAYVVVYYITLRIAYAIDIDAWPKDRALPALQAEEIGLALPLCTPKKSSREHEVH